MKKALLNLFLLLFTVISFTKVSAQDCDIAIPFVETYECDAVNGTYSIDFGIDVENASSDFVDVWINNDFIGQYEIQDFLTINDISLQDNTDDAILLVCVNDNTQCCFVLVYEEPECAEECNFEYLEVEAVCDENGNYNLIIEYGINNPQGNVINLWINGDFYNEYEIQANGFWFIEVEGVEPSGSDLGSILLCSGDGDNCCEDASFEQPECGECSVDYIEVETSECENGTYTLTIFYGISNPGNDFLDLWINNDYYDNYEIDADGEGVIIVDGVEPRENSDYDIVEICVNDNDNCCFVLEYLHPECEETECDFDYIEFSVECNDDGNYNFIIEYGINNPQGNVVNLWFNGVFFGDYETQPDGTGVIEANNVEPIDGNVGTFLLCSGEGEACCQVVEFEQPECEGGECDFEYLSVDATCDENGNYNLIIEYGINNPQGNVVNLWINGDFYSEYEIQANGFWFIEVEGVEPSGSDLGSILLCSGDGDNCCEDANYEQPECEGGEECSVDYINIDYSECINGTYTLSIFYGISNPDNDFLDLWVNNEFVGNYEIDADGEGMIVVDGVEPRENSDYDIVEICVNDNPDCCLAFEYLQPECEGGEECDFEYIEFSVECNDDGNYNFIIEYGVNNPQGNVVNLWFNGDFYGSHETQPDGTGVIEANNISPIDGPVGTFLLCSGEGESCCELIEYEQPECDGGEECNFEYLGVDATCNENGTYDLIIEYGINNPQGNGINLWINGDFYSEYEIQANGFWFIEVEGVEPSGSDLGSILLCSGDGDNCCEDASYEQPECEGEGCSVDYINVDYSECDNGIYSLSIFYGISNPGNDFLDLWVNNEFVGNYEIDADGEGMIVVDGVEPRENSDYDIIEICVNDNPDCCLAFEYLQPECEGGEECSIDWIEIEVLDCNDGEYGLEIYYDVTNPGNDFIELWIEGDYISFYEISNDPISLDGLSVGEGGQIIEIQLCINDVPDCCLTATYEVPECEGGLQDDNPPYEIIVDNSTNEIVLTPLNKLPYNMMMFSMDAKLLQKEEQEEGVSRMPVNEPGIYIVRVETERKVFYSKILYIQ